MTTPEDPLLTHFRLNQRKYTHKGKKPSRKRKELPKIDRRVTRSEQREETSKRRKEKKKNRNDTVKAPLMPFHINTRRKVCSRCKKLWSMERPDWWNGDEGRNQPPGHFYGAILQKLASHWSAWSSTLFERELTPTECSWHSRFSFTSVPFRAFCNFNKFLFPVASAALHSRNLESRLPLPPIRRRDF